MVWNQFNLENRYIIYCFVIASFLLEVGLCYETSMIIWNFIHTQIYEIMDLKLSFSSIG